VPMGNPREDRHVRQEEGRAAVGSAAGRTSLRLRLEVEVGVGVGVGVEVAVEAEVGVGVGVGVETAELAGGERDPARSDGTAPRDRLPFGLRPDGRSPQCNG
jgi:hypothetical protein